MERKLRLACFNFNHACFLMMLGSVVGGWQMARAALAAKAKLDGGTADTNFYNAKIKTARFYAEQTLPRALSHARTIKAGGETMMSLTLDQLRGD